MTIDLNKKQTPQPGRPQRGRIIKGAVVSFGAAIVVFTSVANNVLGVETWTCQHLHICWPGSASDAGTGTDAVSANAIRSPADGEQILHDVTVTGTAAKPARGDELWLFVEVTGNDGRIYPGPGPLLVESKGQWRQNLHVGGVDDAGGDKYVLHLVALSPSAAATIATYRENEVKTGKVVGLSTAQFNALAPELLDDHTIGRR